MENRYQNEADQLGELECEVHAVETADTKKVLSGYCGAVLCVGLACCVPLAKEIKDPQVQYLLAGLILTGAAAFLAYGVYWQARLGKWVAVYERGVLIAHGGGVEVRRWDEIVAIYDSLVHFFINDISSHTNRFVSLCDSAGRTLKFAGRPDKIAHVADAVADQVYERITPRIMDRLAQGETVDFGPLRVSAAGVETADGTLPWDELQTVAIAQGYLRLYERGRRRIWFSTGLGSIPNSRVLLNLFQATLGRADATDSGATNAIEA
jgi:hypothetical protein